MVQFLKIIEYKSLQKFKYIGKKKYILGESPIWDEFYQRLYWVDIEGQSLNAWNYENNLISKWKFKHRICSCLLYTSPSQRD